MTIKNIINIENNRKNFYDIHLFKEGNWWSGYELSAFLCHNYKNQLKDKLKITKKYNKSEKKDLIKIGLMQTSFDKYLPNNQNFIEIIDDNHLIINAKEFIDYEINENNYQILVDDLKNKTNNITNNKENNVNNIMSKQIDNNYTIPSIINDILLFNVENKTNEELITFINEIKEKSTKMFMKLFY